MSRRDVHRMRARGLSPGRVGRPSRRHRRRGMTGADGRSQPDRMSRRTHRDVSRSWDQSVNFPESRRKHRTHRRMLASSRSAEDSDRSRLTCRCEVLWHCVELNQNFQLARAFVLSRYANWCVVCVSAAPGLRVLSGDGCANFSWDFSHFLTRSAEFE